MPLPRITSVHPLRAVEGGVITIRGEDLLGGASISSPPNITLGDIVPRISFASQSAIVVQVPAGLCGGRTAVRIDGLSGETAFVEIGYPVATGLHQVDSPVIDETGRLYVTYSGTRGERSPVSVFRIRNDGYREPFVTGIINATSLVFGPDGALHVSSRFEGAVYRVANDGAFDVVASDLGVACGMAFGSDGSLYVGDRSGTVFRVSESGATSTFANLPESVAAFHLAWGKDEALYVTAPTLASYDNVYRIDQSGKVDLLCTDFGRPQGLAFDGQGVLHVVEALAGCSGVYRLGADGKRTRVVSGPNLVGLNFDSSGGLVVASGETAYRFDDGRNTDGWPSE